MGKTALSFVVAIIYIVAGCCQIYFIEEDNYGVMSGLLTLLVSLPLLVSWLLMGIASALFIGMNNSKGAKIAAIILLVAPTAAISLVSVLLFQDGNAEEKMYPVLPIIGLITSFCIGLLNRSTGKPQQPPAK